MQGSRILVPLILLTFVARAACAQEVGTLAGLEGTAEIIRGGVSTAAAIGAAVQLHDELRTGRPGRLRVVFQDDSVLNIGDDSHVIIDEQVFNPAAGTFRSMIRLLNGKVRALVSEYYQQPNAEYRIETATAVLGVRGTEFVAVYDAAADISEVVGIEGRVAVHSVLDRARRGVFVTSHELTSIARGQFPTPPRQLDDATFRQYTAGVEFIGGGASESMTVQHPLLAGSAVPQADRPEALGPPPRGRGIALALQPHESRQADSIDQPRNILQQIRQNLVGDLGVRF